jgi:hypothetical protein
VEGRRVAWDIEGYVARVRAACFVCELVVGTPGYERDVVWRDDTAVVFLAKYPVAWGHVLVVPVEHASTPSVTSASTSTSTCKASFTGPATRCRRWSPPSASTC